MAFVPEQTVVREPSPELYASICNVTEGIPLLPASDSYKCGTKTYNRTLIESCCDGGQVLGYLGCFTYCEIGPEMDLDRMRRMVNCLSSNPESNSFLNDSSIDENVFCQGNLTATVQTSAGTASRKPTFSSLLITVFVIFFMLIGTVQAQDCTFAIDSSTELIKQGVPQRTTGAGTGCGGSQDFCVVSMSGTAEIVGANRTINGEDASGESYDSFFEVLGQTTRPNRVFPASTSFRVEHWGVGMSGFTNSPYWAPFSYCVNGTASGCDEVDGYVEACGALVEGSGDESIPQGVFLNQLSAF